MTLARKLTGTTDAASSAPIPILRGLWQRRAPNEYVLVYTRPHTISGAPLEIRAAVRFDGQWSWEVDLAHRTSGITRIGDVAMSRRGAIEWCERVVVNHAWRR